MRGGANGCGWLQHRQAHGAVIQWRGKARIQQWLRRAIGAVKLPARGTQHLRRHLDKRMLVMQSPASEMPDKLTQEMHLQRAWAKKLRS